MFKNFAGITLGAVVAIATCLLSGILAIQGNAAREGVLRNLNNVLTEQVASSEPYLHMAALAALSGLVAFLLVIGTRRMPQEMRIGTQVGFAVAGLGLVGWSFTLATGSADLAALPSGTAYGWEGWLQRGGDNPAFHVLILLAIGAVVFWRNHIDSKQQAAK